MLAGVARAGPSYPLLQQNVLRSGATPAVQQRRHMAKVAPTKSDKQRSAGFSRKNVKRDATGAVIPEKKEKSLGAFKPLAVTNLTHQTPGMVGKAAEFPTIDNDPARIYGLPKKMLLEFRILSKPCSVVRDITVQSAQMLDEAKNKSSLETRVVLTGRQGCGKSFLMLQLVEHCIMNDWIVLYIPRAVKLVDSTTPHEYDLRTRTYFQPAFSFQTLQRLQAANHAKLTALTTHKKHIFEKREVPLGTNLSDLINVALKDPPLAPLILEAVMSELSIQTKSPVLFAVDDFQALYCRTAYRDPHFVPIRPHHLSLPRLILDFASGKRSFAKGAFVGAITNSDTVYKLPLELKDALELPHEHFRTPYDKRSRTLVEYTTGLKPIRVPDQLSVTEAASLFEVWKDDKALVSSMYDEVFLSKYTESSGNARDFVWKGLLRTLES
ncbi:hypothetical protein H0H81_003100 [Sphagnurus paluster]|uniref:Small ribosomal subunit protein mS29 n=1 Tax=Sphagnurus paluster TaxID=117069 RepID=A0A9P7K675_9AGAR|nr:hypothetical protein H0H81_003100 [Sphagnurus paluster]